MTTDVLIVGGGIGGLVLAELLGRGKKRVVVLERSTGPPKWNRPEVVWPATAQVLSTLLAKAQLDEAVLPVEGVQVFDGEQFRWAVSPEILQRAQIQPWSTNPNGTREVLMRLSSFELHRGVEVKEVLKEQDRIVGVRTANVADGTQREWVAEITVGDDGAHSLVRTAAGVDLRTRQFPVDLLCFECPWPTALEPNAARIWPNIKDPRSGILAFGMLPIVGQRGVGVVPVRSRIFDDLSHAVQAWRGLIESEPNLAELARGWKFPDDLQRIRRPWGQASRYGAAGALLMGDAAHPVSPAGGQGANMSVADARVLAELILASEKDVLNNYERRRRPANRRSLRFTRAAAFVLGLPEWLLFSRLSLSLVKYASRRPALIADFIRMAATAFLE